MGYPQFWAYKGSEYWKDVPAARKAMIKLMGLGIIAFALLTEGHLPSSVLGEWKVGKPYDVGQPIGLDAKQEEMITGLVIKLSQDQLCVCRS